MLVRKEEKEILVRREEFIAILESTRPGLSQKETLEQSRSTIFRPGEVATFNDEILVIAKSPTDFTCCVVADDLLKLLSRFPDDEVSISLREDESELVLKGRRRSAGLTCEKEIRSPIEVVPRPRHYADLAPGAFEAIRQASRFCSSDETRFLTTVVHVTPDKVEACDNFRLVRFDIPTGFKEEVLIPGALIGALGSQTFTQVAVKEGWTFLQRENVFCALRSSHEKYLEEIDKVTKLMAGAQTIQMPRDLHEIIKRAEVMSETPYDARVTVLLEDGKITLSSRKTGGWFTETKRIKYSGGRLEFAVHPQFLLEVVSRAREVMVDPFKMKVQDGPMTFVAALARQMG